MDTLFSYLRANLGLRFYITARLVFVAFGLFCGLLPVCIGAEDAGPPLAVRINQASVLYQPLMWVGDAPPSDAENQCLWTAVEDMKKHDIALDVPALEQFVGTHANSPWIPSLRANLGRYYFEHGLYTKALESWQLAWDATKDAKDGSAKEVADFTFAYWTHLLASLGRVDTLRSLYVETRGRTFDRGSLQQIVNQGKNGYHMMLSDPGVSFKCGTFAINNIARALQGAAYNPTNILQIPSPSTGFNMTTLLELAKTNGLNLVAAKWDSNKNLVVPSVVHWKENHYVAILQENRGFFLVNDPTFGRERWLSGKDIEEEASGSFLVPGDKLPRGWHILEPAETDQIYGQGYVGGADDGDDSCGNGSGGGPGPQPAPGPGPRPGPRPADTSVSSEDSGGGGAPTPAGCSSCSLGGGSGPNSGGAPKGGGTGGNGASCKQCSGMAVWEVSEPYINVWLYDEPLGYQPAIGGRVSFKLAYKQRETSTTSGFLPYFFNFGPMWNCSWQSYIQDDGAGSSAAMHLAGGGERTYTPDNTTPEFYSYTRLQRNTDGSGNLTGFVLSYANGAKDYYTNFIPSEKLNGEQVAFLTAKVDPFGHVMRFIYQDTGTVALLKYVVDTDGRTNTLTYSNVTYPAQVTGVQDPFGRSTTLTYNASGTLTNIADEVGMNSGFQFDSQGWVTNLTTPYGVTVFQNFIDMQDPANEFDYSQSPYDPYVFERAARVIDAVGGTNIYMLRQDSSLITTNGTDYITFLPSAYDNTIFPASVPTPEMDNYLNYMRDSFHWGPRQAVGLSITLTNFMPADFIKARMRHWLHHESGDHISQSLDFEQAPSPDGVTMGQTTWYDYDGKALNYAEGSDSQPSLVAKVLPDGTTWYTWYQRDNWARPTNVVDTYSTGYGATPLTRTNIYVYDANGVNLVQHIAPLGETTSYGYDAYNNLRFMTDALNEVTSFTYDSQGRRTSIVSPSGLITTNVYYGTGPYSNYLQTTIDLQINRTNSYTYTNDLVYTHTDERTLTTTNTWDALSRLRRVDYPDYTHLTNSYNWLDLVQTVDRMGFTNSYGYDAVRNMTGVTNALGNYTLYNYCTCGSLDSIRDAAGNYTSFTYDNAGDLISVAYPDLYVVNKYYDSLGRVTNTVDSGGVSGTNWYNNQGLIYVISNAVGQVALRTFDLEDRLTNSVDVNNVNVGTSLDLLGRPVTRTYPDGGIESFGYTFDVPGATSYTNQIGNVVLYRYDLANRKTNEVYVGVTTNAFLYNAASDLLALTDGKHDTTSWGYDQFGRVTNKVDAATNLLFVYKYDADNRLTNRWSASKTNTFYTYDAVGNLTHVTYPVSPSITLSYDVLNRLTNMVDAVGTTAYGYDAVGQLLNEDGPWANDTVSYTYANRLKTGLSLQAFNASLWVQTYGYDLGRRLTGITSPAGTFGYFYDPVELQKVDKLTLPNGAYITNAYDAVARLTLTEMANSLATNLDSYAYGYNKASQRTNVVRTAGDNVNYTYDNEGELKTAFGKEAGGGNRWQEQFSYVYDPAGNLNYRTNNTLLQQFNVNTLNELTTITNGGRLTVAGSTTSPATNVTVNTSNAVLYADTTFASTNQPWTSGNNTFTAIAHDAHARWSTNAETVNLPSTDSYTYDLNGNLLSDGNRSFTYDDENELIGVSVASTWSNSFAYDGKMRRRIEKDFSWNAGTSGWQQTNEIHFIYDGNLVVQERDVNNTPQVTYTRGNDLSGTLQGAGGIGGLLARSDRSSFIPWVVTPGGGLPWYGTHSYYHADGNGNVTMLIGSSQMIVAKYLYDPFGNTLAQYGLLADLNKYRFSSKEWNANSGLYYYLYRFYDPSLQRWVNRDPIAEKGFEAIRHVISIQARTFMPPIMSLGVPNLYEFVSNDSIIQYDVYGLYSCAEAKKRLKELRDAFDFSNILSVAERQEMMWLQIFIEKNCPEPPPDCHAPEPEPAPLPLPPPNTCEKTAVVIVIIGGIIRVLVVCLAAA